MTPKSILNRKGKKKGTLPLPELGNLPRKKKHTEQSSPPTSPTPNARMGGGEGKSPPKSF